MLSLLVSSSGVKSGRHDSASDRIILCPGVCINIRKDKVTSVPVVDLVFAPLGKMLNFCGRRGLLSCEEILGCNGAIPLVLE